MATGNIIYHTKLLLRWKKVLPKFESSKMRMRKQKIRRVLMNAYMEVQWFWKITVVCYWDSGQRELELLQTLKRYFYKLDYIKDIEILLDSFG